MVSGAFRTGGHLHQSPIAILAMTGRDTLGYDRTFRILTQMNHLRTRIRLLVVVRHRHTVEFSRRVISRQNTGRVFPRNSRTGFDLRPRQPGVFAANSAFGHEIIDASLALLVARIPVLDGGILHLGILLDDDFDHGGMQLVLVPAGRRTPLQIADISSFVGHDQR